MESVFYYNRGTHFFKKNFKNVSHIKIDISPMMHKDLPGLLAKFYFWAEKLSIWESSSKIHNVVGTPVITTLLNAL